MLQSGAASSCNQFLAAISSSRAVNDALQVAATSLFPATLEGLVPPISNYLLTAPLVESDQLNSSDMGIKATLMAALRTGAATNIKPSANANKGAGFVCHNNCCW